MADDKARNAVVTGASEGIGLAVATALRDEGYRVVAGARTISAELEEITALAVPVDLSTPQGSRHLIGAALAELGGIDLLVNNVAGTPTPSRIHVRHRRRLATRPRPDTARRRSSHQGCAT